MRGALGNSPPGFLPSWPPNKSVPRLCVRSASLSDHPVKALCRDVRVGEGEEGARVAHTDRKVGPRPKVKTELHLVGFGGIRGKLSGKRAVESPLGESKKRRGVH